MDLQLCNKSAIVTGSTAGIGLATATLLAREGASVTINGRNQERVDQALEIIQTEVPGCIVAGVAADLATAEGCNKITQVANEIDILVNNLGLFAPRGFTEISDDEWTSLFAANVMSGVRLSRFYLPKMLSRRQGRILFISSEAAVQIPPEMIHYGMTKVAQVAVARGIAELTAGTEVTSNAVLVGPTRSEGVNRFIENLALKDGITVGEVEADFFASVRPGSLLRRFIAVDEIAKVIVFLCSEAALTINGAAVRADGGVVRSLL